MEGIEHERQGNLEKAAEAYRKAIRPFMSTANYLAWVYQAEGRLEDALSLSRSTVIVDPDNPDYRDTLAVILCKTGNRSAALEHMQKAAEAGGEFEARLSRMEGGDCE
jgi:tetratricopeptide (TPR) repeat protein